MLAFFLLSFILKGNGEVDLAERVGRGQDWTGRKGGRGNCGQDIMYKRIEVLKKERNGIF